MFELTRRCLRGDSQAFEPLVKRYERVVFNVALRMVGNYEDARDIAQTTFVKAYEHLGTYDPQYALLQLDLPDHEERVPKQSPPASEDPPATRPGPASRPRTRGRTRRPGS